MKVKIAAIQFDIKQFAPEKNLKKAEEYIKKAASAGADLVIFPEDFLTGPIGTRLEEFADTNNTYCKHFLQLARKYEIDIVPGTIIEKGKRGYTNTTYYLDYKGTIKARYNKINLWHRNYLDAKLKVAIGAEYRCS